MEEKFEYENYQVFIEVDQDPPNPREDYNLGVMACWHRNYVLGDVQPEVTPLEYKKEVLEDLLGEEVQEDEVESKWDANFTTLPLYLYDHSGITVSTSPFSCSWDSGQIGFIYMKEDGYLDTEQGRERHLQNLKTLEDEVATYDMYLVNDVWKYTITHRDQEVDSCCGYFGYDQCVRSAKESIDILNQIGA
jgi:hypothetical protein